MSSMYRKGRDGYFYYQAYILNGDTGKKDKRVFHSLGTKERNEAEKKQKELDIEYEKQFKKKNQKPITNKKKVFICLITIIIIMSLAIIKSTDFKRKAFDDLNIESNLIAMESKEIKELKYTTPVNISNPEVTNSSDTLVEKNDKNGIDIVKQKTLSKSEYTLPIYKLERVLRLSDAFKQGKIFITVNKNSKREEILLLCEKITREFSEFSNIVICVYSNSEVGKRLANGKDFDISNKEKKESWLAMYSYNPVEGAYFDDKPGGYLGG